MGHMPRATGHRAMGSGAWPGGSLMHMAWRVPALDTRLDTLGIVVGVLAFHAAIKVCGYEYVRL